MLPPNLIIHQTHNLFFFFYVQSKTTIALVCDEKEIGKVDPMNSDSSLYVSTKHKTVTCMTCVTVSLFSISAADVTQTITLQLLYGSNAYMVTLYFLSKLCISQYIDKKMPFTAINFCFLTQPEVMVAKTGRHVGTKTYFLSRSNDPYVWTSLIIHKRWIGKFECELVFNRPEKEKKGPN